MVFIENDSNDAAFHFSVEDFFTRFYRSDSTFLMLWQTEKTVMLGNNQFADSEVDIDFALENEIAIRRRSSGGGAIFTDPGTLLYTVIEPLVKEASVHREEVAAAVIESLCKMGVPAVREGRNDILIDGRKISGFAQYASGTHVCTHGSLLYDTDLEVLTKVLIPNDSKLRPKGITSIRSRVTNIKPHLDHKYSILEFIYMLRNELLHGNEVTTYKLSVDDLKHVDQIYHEKYSNRKWNLGL